MPCAHVIFDTEPTPRGKSEAPTVDEMSHAMIRSVYSFGFHCVDLWVLLATLLANVHYFIFQHIFLLFLLLAFILFNVI